MLANAPDPVVDANCRENDLVLITHNYKHFRRIAREHAIGGRAVKELSRIDMEIHQSAGPARIALALPHIETEWRLKKGVGLKMSICRTVIRIHD